MPIEVYDPKYKEEIIALILNIQNNEAKIGLSLLEQPDLLDIERSYRQAGGEFWVARLHCKVVGTIGLMLRENHCAVLKKFFVQKEYRSQKIGLALYRQALEFAKSKGVRQIILDTPFVAKRSHKFYEQAGFQKIQPSQLPVPYSYPDRNSILYLLNL